ncbi:MAG: TIGR03619 family F420-dependent LLM class oxidoreductase [Candidatus Binatia bacterium]|nr:TIGR03619 family F420-dependent LLM class oxidoreductase [Candidatus Binatia bacterium]
MEFGVALPHFGPQARAPGVAERLRDVAQAADRLGYDIVWTAEHVIFPRSVETPYPYGDSFPYDINDPVLDPVATLSWVAAATTHVRLGSAVLVLPYHHPVTLAKSLATLDVLSGGRVLLGVAGGWLREEFELLGVPFKERGARTDEAIDLMKHLWTTETADFEGRFHQVRDAAFFPKPIQAPHPPIWIGGDSAAALRRAATRGDGWLAAPRDLPTLEKKIEQIRRLAEDAGRDPATIGVATSGGARTLDEMIDFVPKLEKIGVTVMNMASRFWASTPDEAIDLLESFASRAGLTPRTVT